MISSFLENLAYFLVPAALAGILAYRRSKTARDEWKLLVWVPVLPLFIWGIYIAWGTAADPTSHNLWPFELVIWAALSGALSIVIRVAQFFVERSRRDIAGN